VIIFQRKAVRRLLENEKFQELVINHLVKLTQDLAEFKQEMAEFKQETKGQFAQIDKRFEQIDKRFEQIDKRFDRIETRLDRLEQKQDIANVQIAELLEFKTDVTQKLDNLLDDVKFLKYKESQHEEDIFYLKNHLQVIK
jgi:DNA repair ATPase RecN